MRRFSKEDFPVANVRRFLEPGPIVLVSSAHRRRRNIMTLGWHMILEMEPSLVGCYIWDRNDSHAMIRASRECVINVPTADLIHAVIDIGNTHGRDGAECHACFECRLVDASLIPRYSLFVLEVVKAHVARSPRHPVTVHYRGEGVFMISGRNVSYRKRFKPENLV